MCNLRILAAQESLKVAYLGEAPSGGYFSPICIFGDVPTDHSIWREEIFAPVLACAPATDIDTAIAMANDSQYALTGTIVGRQPFGGFRLSGIGSKVGEPDCLLQFVEPRTATENMMRKGFTLELVV